LSASLAGLLQSHSRAAAVLGNELDACLFEGSYQRRAGFLPPAERLTVLGF
jgi:hypothetical protein